MTGDQGMNGRKEVPEREREQDKGQRRGVRSEVSVEKRVREGDIRLGIWGDKAGHLGDKAGHLGGR